MDEVMKSSALRWFESEEFWRDLAEKIYTPDQATAARTEASQVEQLLQLAAPSSILDMCCGNGRHAVEFAKRGYSVTGVDLNDSYLQRGRDAAAEQGIPVNFVHSDMRTFASATQFDVALVMWNAFGYFETDAEDLAALSSLYQSLRPRGRLLIQTHGRESTARKFVRKDWFEIGDSMILDQRWIENNWTTMRTRYVSISEGCRKEHTMSCRLYAPDQLTGLLTSAGFITIQIFGGLDGRPYDERAFELVVVAGRG